MISDKLYDLFLAKTDLELTDEQQEVLQKLAVFVTQPDERIFILRGYAGTGKSTIISIVAQTLKSMKMKSHLLAPTGRAAKVMNSYSECRLTPFINGFIARKVLLMGLVSLH